MARVTHVKKAQKDQGPCHRCRQPIKRGDSYRWFANRIGRYSQRKNFCANCQIRPSDRTTSPHLSALYSAIEAAEDALGGYGWEDNNPDDIGQTLNDCAEAVREVGEGYRESAQNIEEGFGHATYQSDELNEKADELDSFADELDSAADEILSMPDWTDEADIKGEFDGDLDDDDEPEDADEYQDFLAEKKAERFDEAIGAAHDALGNSPM